MPPVPIELRPRITEGIPLPILLGLIHFAVDASSNFVMARILRAAPAADFVTVLVVYNALAFAVQPLVGLVTDRLHAPRAVMAGGLLLASAAMVLCEQAGPTPLVLTGLGNALFHVGGGTIASTATPGRASGPGLFIGPGAIGVVAGAMAGTSLPGAYWPLTLFLLVCAPMSVYFSDGLAGSPPQLSKVGPRAPVPEHARAILILLLLATAGRAMLGARVGSQLAHHVSMALPLATAACLGKALGGIVADRAGWLRSAIVFLVVSSMLLSLGGRSEWAALGGVGLFQSVTSITLAAIYRVLPSRIALGFGLACLALFVGSLPAILRIDWGVIERGPVNSLLALLSAVAVWRALSWFEAPAGAVVRVTQTVAQPTHSRE